MDFLYPSPRWTFRSPSPPTRSRVTSWIDRALTFKSEPMKAALADGGYTADVESSSSMFKVVACALSIKNGKITATVTLSGDGYDKLFVGSAGLRRRIPPGTSASRWTARADTFALPSPRWTFDRHRRAFGLQRHLV